MGLVDALRSPSRWYLIVALGITAWLAIDHTPEHAQLLTRTNAQRVLDGETPVPVPPIPRQRGVFGRLRELFLRR